MNQELTSKEIMMRAVQFKNVPRTPVAIIDGGIWMVNHNHISFADILKMPDYGSRLVLDTFETIRSDIVWVCQGLYNLGLRAMGAKVDCSKIGEGVEVLEPLIKDPNEIQKFDPDEIHKKMKADPGIQAMLEQTRRVSAAVGEEKCVAINYIGPFTLASQMMGVSQFMSLLFDEDIDLHPLLEFATKMCYTFFDLFLDAGADTVFIGDPSSSGDLVSPRIFEEFGLPYIKKLNAMIGDRAAIKFLHICGNTASRLELLKDSGIDAFSLDSVDIKEAMDIADKKYAIFGNISPLSVLNDKNTMEVEKVCTETARTGGLNGGFVMMPGCDLTPSTPIENIQAMIRAAHNNVNRFFE